MSSLRIRVQVARMLGSRLHGQREADALRFGLRQQVHWLPGSWVSSRMAIGSPMIRRPGSSNPRRRRSTGPGPVRSRNHRRFPPAEPRLPVRSSPRLCLPLRPTTPLDVLRIMLRRSRLNDCQVKQAMRRHRIAAIRRRTRKRSHGMRPRSPDLRRQRNKRLRLVRSRVHRHLLLGELQLAVPGSPHRPLPLRSITAAHFLRMLLH